MRLIRACLDFTNDPTILHFTRFNGGKRLLFIGRLKVPILGYLSWKTGQIFADRLELISALFFTCYRTGIWQMAQANIEWKTDFSDFSTHFSRVQEVSNFPLVAGKYN